MVPQMRLRRASRAAFAAVLLLAAPALAGCGADEDGDGDGAAAETLTVLAAVLAIGLCVDDAVVILENVRRRQQELGEKALLAAARATRPRCRPPTAPTPT